MRDKHHLALRKTFEEALATKGHQLGRWNGVLDDKIAYCQTCRAALRIYATRSANPNTGAGKRYPTQQRGAVLIADGALADLPACPRPWKRAP